MKGADKIRDAAKGHGWRVVPGTNAPMVQRVRQHTTPQDMKDRGWYSGDTYESFESLSFVSRGEAHVPIVFHTVSRNPWTMSTDAKITFRRALEILASPYGD